ncbi:hypothetical protein BJ322DRAFT_1196951 [Thelephora terrestris]|uniref:F-box domain-containing protein n=1 Tax=Thelephora terrestris TaxID=56493 RepID=A0A9P6HBY9_9AGAM|nr:hypothetical protein BJ322DRAFT_1196951 [Thelephora terrestris]
MASGHWWSIRTSARGWKVLNISVSGVPSELSVEASEKLRNWRSAERPHLLLHQAISMGPHPIIEISELTQVILDHCLLLGNGQSLVSLACTCRALEEQALSTLWSKQSSLETLIRSTVRRGIMYSRRPLPQATNAEWDRFRRYASWMRKLLLQQERYGMSKEVFRFMSLGLSDGVVCPELQDLEWGANRETLPFHRLLLSPKLKTFSFTYKPGHDGSSEEDISILQSMIMGLDTFHLQELYLRWEIPEEANRQIGPIASSAVLLCGPALKELCVYSPLSDAAIQHTMQLPNLRIWHTPNGPPKTTNLALPDIFPRLEYLSLAEEVSLEWLTFLTKTARHIPSEKSSYPPLHRGPVQTLRGLFTFMEVPIDADFMSPITLFRELIFLCLTSSCSTAGGCGFSLTDDDIAEIATALPRLVEVSFGTICSANSCRTTVASLVSFSTQCRGLEQLEVHFNTENLRNDLELASADPRLTELPSLRTSNIFHLFLSSAPYTIDEDDLVPVLRGFHRIFSSLTKISGDNSWWSPSFPEGE